MIDAVTGLIVETFDEEYTEPEYVEEEFDESFEDESFEEDINDYVEETIPEEV